MYIITGEAKGKRLKTPKGRKIRPTTSRVKKSIFDILGNLREKLILDIFAGSGNLGIESLSAGATCSTFIEKDKQVVKYLKENINSCGYKNRATVLNFDFKKALSILTKNRDEFDIIFIDPPYDLYNTVGLNELATLCNTVLKKNGLIIIEHNIKTDIVIDSFDTNTKKYGSTFATFARKGS